MATASELIQRDYDLSLGTRLAICAAAFALAALPILLTDNLPFVDYPNHLARFYIWQNLENSEHLSRFYERRDGLHPYWAMRLFINGLSPLVGLENAGRIFVVLATLMPAAGACCVGWVIAQRVTLIPLASISVAYNYLAAWGFHNFLFACGLALMVFALWIVQQHAPAWKRIAITAVLALVLANFHLLSAGILALLLFAWEMAAIAAATPSGPRVRTAVLKCAEIAAVMIPAVIYFLALDASALGDTTTADGGVFMRFISLVSPFVMFGTEIDFLFSAAPLLLLAAAIGAGAFKLPKRAVIFVAILLVVSLIAPYKLFGVAINWRIPLFVVIALFAMTMATGREAAIRNGVALAIAGLIMLRTINVSLQLQHNSDEIAELKQSAAMIEKGSRVLPAFAGLPKKYYFILSGDRFAQIGAHLIADREILFPLLFPFFDIGFRSPYSKAMVAGARVIKLTDLDRDQAFFAARANRPISYVRNWRRDFDYLLVFGEVEDGTEVTGTQLVSQGSYFQIRKIVANGNN